MYRLGNDHLTVHLLDPAAEHPAHGARYCRGGYIWQVCDRVGDLLAGPEYPEPAPDPFNGQGLPEVFRPTDKQAGARLTQHADGTGLVIGIGRCSGGLTPQTVVIDQPCPWTVTQADDRIRFVTADAVEPWAYRLQREVRLSGRQLSVTNHLTNTGAEVLPLQWYAHPFFAHAGGLTSCHFSEPVGCADNPGFSLVDGLLAMRPAASWTSVGHFQWLDLPGDWRLAARLSHPRLAGIDLLGDFVVARMPVWANDATFSIEPYLDCQISPGAATSWTLTYRFGESG